MRKLFFILFFIHLASFAKSIDAGHVVYLTQDLKQILKFGYSLKDGKKALFGRIYSIDKKDSLVFIKSEIMLDTSIIAFDTIRINNLLFHKASFIPEITKSIAVVKDSRITVKKKECFIDELKSGDLYETKGALEISLNQKKRKYKFNNSFEAESLDDAKTKDYEVKAWSVDGKRMYIEIILYKRKINYNCHQASISFKYYYFVL